MVPIISLIKSWVVEPLLQSKVYGDAPPFIFKYIFPYDETQFAGVILALTVMEQLIAQLTSIK